jgi:hypothetical protein
MAKQGKPNDPGKREKAQAGSVKPKENPDRQNLGILLQQSVALRRLQRGVRTARADLEANSSDEEFARSILPAIRKAADMLRKYVNAETDTESTNPQVGRRYAAGQALVALATLANFEPKLDISSPTADCARDTMRLLGEILIVFSRLM